MSVLFLTLLTLLGFERAGAATIRSVHDVSALGNADAGRGYPVELQGVVTYSDPEWGLLFMEDSTGAIYVNVHGSTKTLPLGSRIRVTAVTAKGDFSPVLANPKVRILGPGPLPAATGLSLSKLDAGSGDSRYILTEGVLRPGNQTWDRICFRIFDGPVWALVVIPQKNKEFAQRLIGAKVRVRGVAGSRLDGTGKRVGAQLFVSRLEDIEIDRDEPHTSTPDGPVQAIRALAGTDADRRFVSLAHVRGVVTWERPGLFFARDESGVICVLEDGHTRVQRGSIVDIRGFPTHGEQGLTLVDVAVQTIAGPERGRLIPPVRTTAAEVLHENFDRKPVQLSARLIEQTANSTEHTFLLEDNGQLFRATLPRIASAEELVRLPLNTTLDLTGMAVIRNSSQDLPPQLSILIASPADFIVISGNGWLTLKRLLSIFGCIGLAAVATFVWIKQLRRTVRAQTATIRARLEREMQLETQYKRLFERNLAAVFRWSPDGTILDCNAAFVRMLGFQSCGELIGRSYWEYQLDPSGREPLLEALSRAGVSNRDANLQRADGERVCLLENITAVETAEGLLYETTAIDVTQLRQNQAELQRAKDAAVHQSLNDVLTGLPNRRLLWDRMSHMLARARREGQGVALLYIDLDGFKLVNDSLGHGVGDALLIQVAARLQSRVRASDTLARLGGDEFVVVLAGVPSKHEPARVADDILGVLSEPFLIEDHEIAVGACIGMSVFPDHGEEVADLLQKADNAMYAAKKQGKNRAVLFTPGLGSALRERLNLEHQLRGALGRNEIVVHYQPEFDANSGTLIRFEALARWTHPNLGAIPPDKFIPIAEESGLIVPLGAYILERACIEAANWQTIFPDPVQLGVNVSSIQFLRESFAQEVIDILARTGLRPNLLQLELTESVMMSGNGVSTEAMRTLRAAGISLAIDDFGTGYSCLSSLQSAPFDYLKIDRCFIKELGKKPEGELMVRSVVAFAHNIGMRVIVEGIETEQQLEMIRKLGGDEVQGYLMGRPTGNPRAVIVSQQCETRTESLLQNALTDDRLAIA